MLNPDPSKLSFSAKSDSAHFYIYIYFKCIGQWCRFLHEWTWSLLGTCQWQGQVTKFLNCKGVAFLKNFGNKMWVFFSLTNFLLKKCCSQVQFLTSGAGSKAWRGDIKELNKEGLNFFYDGQGFMSVNLTPTDVEIAFYDVFGKVLHRLNKSKLLHSSI